MSRGSSVDYQGWDRMGWNKPDQLACDMLFVLYLFCKCVSWALGLVVVRSVEQQLIV